MSNPSMLGAIEWQAEASFGDTVETYDKRFGVLDRIDISGLDHSKIDPARVVQYRGELTPLIQGIQGGKIKTRHWLAGHEGSTAGAGAQTPTVHEQLLGIVLGAIGSPGAGTTPAGTTFTGGTALVPTTAASGTFPAGGVMRGGALNDNRGNGQFYPLATHVAANMTLLQAMDGAPIGGDVCYSPTLVYERSDPTATAVTGIRMRFLGPNLVYSAHGCHCESITVGGLFVKNECPFIEYTWDVGFWGPLGSITPISAIAPIAANPAPNAGGSFHFQDVGNTASNKFTLRDFSLTYNLAVIREEGTGTKSPWSNKTGARRVHRMDAPAAVVSFAFDADSQTATPQFDAAFLTGTTSKLGMYTLSSADGSAMGILMRSMKWAGNRPTMEDQNGKLVRRATLHCGTGATLTDDLTRAPVVWCFA